MVRFLFSLLLLVHGLLHLLGLGRAYRILPMPQQRGGTLMPYSPTSSKTFGWAWGLAGGLFLVAAVYLVQQKAGWWLPGTAALLISQALILLNRPATKSGTLINVTVLAGLVLPAKAAVTRKPDSGNFTWFKPEITDLSFNTRELPAS